MAVPGDTTPRAIPGFTRNQALRKATFISRPNRFLVVVRTGGGPDSDHPATVAKSALRGPGDNSTNDEKTNGREVTVHVADSARMEELLVLGRTVYLAPVGSWSDPEGPSTATDPTSVGSPVARSLTRSPRKTACDLVLVDFNGTLVSIDSRVPNKVMSEALRMGFFKELEAYPTVISESRHGESRLDFRLSGPDREDCLVEVKSVTLVQKGRALFPDAPTALGARHMRELIGAVAEGLRALAVFIVQREDARAFSPNDATDPEFGRTLREAARAGVGVWAYTCDVTTDAVRLGRRIPVIL
ncbi:MAG: DNA/RNA nuclease SfsA [Bacillota bacterium]